MPDYRPHPDDAIYRHEIAAMLDRIRERYPTAEAQRALGAARVEAAVMRGHRIDPETEEKGDG